WTHLEGAELVLAHFEWANLAGTHMENARLLGASFDHADASGHIRRGDLQGRMISFPPLEGTEVGLHLDDADLSWVSFEDAGIGPMYLAGADLSWANLKGADLREAVGLTPGQLHLSYDSSGLSGPEINTSTRLPEDLAGYLNPSNVHAAPPEDRN